MHADGPRSALPPLSSGDAQARYARALSLYSRGQTLLRSGETLRGQQLLDQAIDVLRTVVAVEPRAWVFYSLGQALRMRGDCEAAVVAYRGALALIPREPLEEQAKVALEARTKQQIGDCVTESPVAATPTARPPPVVLQPQQPVVPPPPEPLAVPRATRATRYSLVLPATTAALAVVVAASGGALYAMSSLRYHDLLEDGCGVTQVCSRSSIDGARAIERAAIGLFVLGGAIAAVDVGLWSAWRRH